MFLSTQHRMSEIILNSYFTFGASEVQKNKEQWVLHTIFIKT